MRLVRLVCLAVAPLLGCVHGGAELPDYVTHPRTAYTTEGEVRDEVTFAPVPEAEVIVETDRRGYVMKGRADAGGRFVIGYSAALEIREGLVLPCFDDKDATLVYTVSIRAERGGRCSPTQRFDLEDVPRSGLVLLVGDCAVYRARARDR